MRLFFYAITLLALLSCTRERMLINKSGPLVTVIKLNSAESSSDRREAEKYIDIESVYDPRKYTDEITEHTPSPGEIYEKYLALNRRLAGDKKFTSEFMYHKYYIEEIIFDGFAEIAFTSQESDEKIIYKLKNVDDHWVVIDIIRR